MSIEKILSNLYVADIETIGFLDELKDFSDLHVVSVGKKQEDGSWGIFSFRKKEDVQRFFGNKDLYIVMHNGIRYDKPALEKMGIKVNATIIDTLPLAWNLLPTRSKMKKKFGLGSFGEDYGIPKPKVDDWKNLSYEEYKYRCEEDVKINIRLWEELLHKGLAIYSKDTGNFVRLLNLLNFIMTCSYKQEMQGLHVDVDKVKENLDTFEKLKEDKIEKLRLAMPKIPVKVTKSKPKVTTKKDGTFSKAGEEWYKMLRLADLPNNYEGVLELIKDYEEPNPNSVSQKKAWLYSLGWKPKTWKSNRNKETGEVKEVEQIMTDEKMLCESVLKLMDKEPAIEELDGLTVLTHRIGILKSFLAKKDDNNMVAQGLQQLALTMRWQHSVIVNLPRYTGKGDLRDGKWIRECLVPPPGKKIIQADLSGIESRTSDHYTFNINPERIQKTKMPYFDPHLEISVFAGLMTKGQETFFVFQGAVKDNPDLDVNTFSELYKPDEETFKLLSLSKEDQKEWMNRLKAIRSKGKTTNYASLYLVGAATLSKSLEISKKEAQDLIEAYWKIHFAVKEFSETLKVIEVDNESWVFNPISKLYYYVRNSKDLFSTINQSSAVYCFNMWLFFITKRGHWPVNQTHDDCVLLSDNNEEDIKKTKQVFHDAMDDLNKYLKLNVMLDCDSQVGNTLAETH